MQPNLPVTQMITPSVIRKTMIEVLQEVEQISKRLFITDNEIMVNAGKCHLLFSSDKNRTTEVNGCTVKMSYCEKLLGKHFDNQLKFDFYIEEICENTNRKIHALARVTP